MSLQRSLLIRGPAKVSYDGATFYQRGDIEIPLAPATTQLAVPASGYRDEIRTDFVITFQLQPYGAWENLSILFPAAILTPVPGTSLFSGADKPLTITGRNGDSITLHNARIIGLANLFGGVNESLFSSAVQFVALLRNNFEPDATNAYYTIGTGGAYGSDTDFETSLNNFKQQAYSAAWTGKAGFSAFQFDKGFNLSWSVDARPHVNSNLGTIDYIIGENGLIATLAGVPLQPTLAQVEAAAEFQGQLLGARRSTSGADLTLTGSGVAITLKKAHLSGWTPMFGVEPLRIGNCTWVTTRGFTTGTADAVATIA